ncbi:hypothetical protein AX16_000281 [Volvariella volvacea WC 439]|nr:hypothetical protein AX16_000281 [Volvariella volvacea WC 439]
MAEYSGSEKFVAALIVIDMQYDFVHGSLAVPDAPSIIDTVNLVSSLPFATRIATKDYHPRNHISFADNHGKPVFSKITIYPPGETEQQGRGLEQVLWPIHCVAGTPGAEFVEGLKTDIFDAVVHKGDNPGIECYSGFRDPWHISATQLLELLQSKGVTDVFVVGLAADFCVKHTALDAVDFGYKVWVVKDATKSVGSDGQEWNEMIGKGIKPVESSGLKELLSR